MNVNNFLDQVRFRVEEAERRFRHDVRAVQRTQAAAGSLESGATIAKVLRLFEDEFAKLTDEMIIYLGKVVERTDLDRAELLGLTAQLLMQSKAVHKAIVDKQRLVEFAPGKRIEAIIDEAFERGDQRLTLRLQEFSFGVDDASPRADGGQPLIPASDRYVTILDNLKAKIGSELAELKEIVRGDNEVDDDSKLIAISEIAIFEATIAAPRVATDLLERFVTRVLKWMTLVFGGAVLAEAAQRLVQALLPLLG